MRLISASKMKSMCRKIRLPDVRGVPVLLKSSIDTLSTLRFVICMQARFQDNTIPISVKNPELRDRAQKTSPKTDTSVHVTSVS